MKEKKNKHAVALGKLGGAAGYGKVKARTSEQARTAVMVRWRKYYAKQKDMLKMRNKENA